MALGRGLGDILSEVEASYEKDLGSMGMEELKAQGKVIAELEVETIQPNPYQPRKHFDSTALQELSESIREHGLLQPVVVIAKERGYLLVAGERRLRAHKLAQLDTIQAIVMEVDIEEARLRELALIENIQRENLNAIELATSYAELIEVHQITHDELSTIVHKSRSQITNTMRLLSLSAHTKEQIASGRLSQGHAKVLVGLDEANQKIVVNSIIGQKLSVRDAERMVKRYKNPTPPPQVPKQAESWLEAYAPQLNASLPFKHTIKKQTLEISFETQAEIEAFLRRFER